MLLLIPSAAADPAHVCRNNSQTKIGETQRKT